MIGQFIFFALFVLTFLAGVFDYFTPKHQPHISSLQLVPDSRDYEPQEESNTRESQQLNVTTSRGVSQIRQQMDELTQEQNKLKEIINDDQQVLDNTNKEIADIVKQVNGKNDADVLRLNAVVAGLQNNQRLLVDRGQALIAFNDQLTKRRQWLAEQSKLINENSGSSLGQHNTLLDDQSSELFDKIAERTNDIIERTQEKIDDERQKAQDQQDR